MSRASRNIAISLNIEILRPSMEPAYPIPVTEWNRLMDRVRRCEDTSQFFQSLGWGLLGSAMSAFLAAIALPFTVDFIRPDPVGVPHAHPVNIAAICVESLCCVVFLVGVISGGVSPFYAARHRRERSDLRQLIVEDMQVLASRYALPPAPLISEHPPVPSSETASREFLPPVSEEEQHR
jgi:hypothetical protein